jgi:hypothetical protein
VEETDPEGRLLSRRVLQKAAEGARAAVPEAHSGEAGWRYLVQRAQWLAGEVGEGLPAVPGGALRRWAAPLLLALAVVVGLGTAVLGPERRINLLSLPLFGILLWNLGLYLFLGIRAVLRRRVAVDVTGGVFRWLRWGVSQKGGAPARLAQLWMPVAAPLEGRRLRRLLHGAALVVALGAVGGMYLRGLAFAYQVTWESTFLEARQVQGILDTTLGPAAALLGTAVRPVAPLEAPGAEGAGPWVHLFAVTLLLGVGLPRLALVAWESLRIAHLRRHLPMDLNAAYFRRRLAEGRGEARRLDVVPYSFEPTAAAVAALRGALKEALGSRAEVHLQDPLPYGARCDLPGEPPGAGPLREILPLFALGQTPEEEVHGEWLHRLGRGREPAERWAVVEAGGFAGTEERREGRARIWRRLCREAGFEALVVDLAAEPADALFRQIEAACHKAAEGTP